MHWFTLILLSLVFGATVHLVHRYAKKKTPKYIYVLVFVGWFLGLGILAVLPYDVQLVNSSQAVAD